MAWIKTATGPPANRYPERRSLRPVLAGGPRTDLGIELGFPVVPL